jgi:hypothetical protein
VILGIGIRGGAQKSKLCSTMQFGLQSAQARCKVPFELNMSAINITPGHDADYSLDSAHRQPWWIQDTYLL